MTAHRAILVRETKGSWGVSCRNPDCQKMWHGLSKLAARYIAAKHQAGKDFEVRA